MIDVRVTDTDQPSYLLSLPSMIIANQERKKKKYLDACLQQQRHFSTFVVDVYRSLGAEAKVVNKNLATQLVSKWRNPYSVMCGLINARMSVAILRAAHMSIQGS